MGLPNLQQAQYGDRVSLDKLAATRKTNNPAVDVQSMTGGDGGRPIETDPVKLAMRSIKGGQQQQATPEEQQYGGRFNDLAVQYQTAMKWQRIASQPGAGPFTKAYAVAAIREFTRNFMALRQQTPFFDGI